MPSGWKRRSADIFCDACWGKRYVLRAITVPVVAPVDIKWEELGGVLRQMWAASTQASNWILTELYAREAPAFECDKAGYHWRWITPKTSLLRLRGT
jgi:hypothetical protein